MSLLPDAILIHDVLHDLLLYEPLHDESRGGRLLLRFEIILYSIEKAINVFEPIESYHLQTSHLNERATSSSLSVAPGVVSLTTHCTSSPKTQRTVSWPSTNSASSRALRSPKIEWTPTSKGRHFHGASQDTSSENFLKSVFLKSRKRISENFSILKASENFRNSLCWNQGRESLNIFELRRSVRFSDIDEINEIISEVDELDLDDGPD